MKKYKDYLITFGVAAVIALLVCLFKEISRAATTIETVSILSDACFTSAVVIGGFGLIGVVSNGGNFDTLFYGIKILRHMWKKSENKSIEKNLFEYKRAKEEKRMETKHLLLVGLLFFLFAIIFTIIFYQMY